MSTNYLVFVAAIASSLAAGSAFAESEGSGEPFAFHSGARPGAGRAFVTEAVSGAYPEPTGNEAPVQTANSMPRWAGDGSLAFTQASRLDRRFAAKRGGAPFLETGTARPRG